MLEEVLDNATLEAELDVAVECWFYAFVHRPENARSPALSELKRLLLDGARSPEWNLSSHVAHARADEREDVEWIAKLAAVVSDQLDAGELDGWDEWRAA